MNNNNNKPSIAEFGHDCSNWAGWSSYKVIEWSQNKTSCSTLKVLVRDEKKHKNFIVVDA